MAIKQLSAPELQNKLLNGESLCLLDVREPYEFAYASLANSVLIPLHQLPARLGELDPERETVVICHHGVRSQQAALYLAHCGFQRIANLSGGIDAWSLECDASVPRY
ncbi:rhodanese-like domain-containing protein [Methylosarcina fibrata]|uniref:rhodanese-like domain-containing protein n=1 Tax=Methylosarcina fibrata TaxID=105972 RepID=UPI00036C298E|nr:rhodanese-like domain-containing protein [Methylosarcina fibrata]